MKNRLALIGTTLAAMMVVGAHAQELTVAQEGVLATLSAEYAQKEAQLGTAMQDKLIELAIDLQREGRLATEAAAKESSDRVNGILKNLSDLYGQVIKTKVEFLIAAKNTLTIEQKLLLLSQLQPQESLPYDTIVYMQPDIFDVPADLTVDQRKSLVRLEANLLMKEVELECEVELTLLDLEGVLLSGEASPSLVDPLILRLAELAGQEVDNRVNYFLKGKDVLTLDQKRLLSSLMGLD